MASSSSAESFISLKNIYSCAPATERGRPTLLNGHPKLDKLVYGCGNLVITRSLSNPLDTEIYSEHAHTVTAACYSPSGFYIASGDSAGNVRIWATNNADRTLKLEIRPISGSIRDIAWSGDNQRILVVGDGKETFGSVFIWDTGSTVGEIAGHSKQINSCSFRQDRPFRLATGSEDFQVSFFEGPPFKFKLSHKLHTRFVNCVRFSPNGAKFITVGSDGKGYLFEGKTAEKVGELSAENAHTGSIYSCAWSPDSTRILTASADKTAKIWDAESGACLSTFTFPESTPSSPDFMQISALWIGDKMITLSLNGDINYLDASNPARPARVIAGHNKNVTALAYDAATQTLYSGDNNGTINRWTVGRGSAGRFSGKGHPGEIRGLSIQNGKLVSVSVDDSVRVTDLSATAYDREATAECTGTPLDMAASARDATLSLVLTSNKIFVLREGRVATSVDISFRPLSLSLSPDDTEVAVGSEDTHIYLFSLEGDVLRQKSEKLSKHRGAVTRVRYSPDGASLAAGDSNREVIVWDRESKQPRVTGLVYHNSRVTSLAWSADCRLLVSGALDNCIIVWNLEDTTKRVIAKSAHINGVTSVVFLSEHEVASAGNDCCVKTWNFGF